MIMSTHRILPGTCSTAALGVNFYTDDDKKDNKSGDKKKGMTAKSHPDSRHGGEIPASEFSKGLPLVDDLVRKGLDGSYDYVTGSVFDVKNPEHCRKFYDTHGIDGKPAAIIGRTNHHGPFDQSSRHAFRKVVSEGYTPSIGTWTNRRKRVFNDVSMIVSADKDELLRLKKKHDQLIILVVYENGEPDFI